MLRYLVCELVESLGEAREGLEPSTSSGNDGYGGGRACDIPAGELEAISLATLVVEAARRRSCQVSSRGLSCEGVQALTRSARCCSLLHLGVDHRRTKGKSVGGGQLGSRCWRYSKSEVKVVFPHWVNYSGRLSLVNCFCSPPSLQARRADFKSSYRQLSDCTTITNNTLYDTKGRLSSRQNGRRMESCWLDVCDDLQLSDPRLTRTSYNRYLAVSARVVRRSLKENARVQAERRGEMDLRFAKWEVSQIKESGGQGEGADTTCRTASKAR